MRRLAKNTGLTLSGRQVWEAASCTMLPTAVLAPAAGRRALTVPGGTTAARDVLVGADFLTGAASPQHAVGLKCVGTESGRDVYVAVGCPPVTCCGIALADLPTTINLLVEKVSGVCAGWADFTIPLTGTTASFLRTASSTSPFGFGTPSAYALNCGAGIWAVEPSGRFPGAAAPCNWRDPLVSGIGTPVVTTVTCSPFSVVSYGWRASEANFFGYADCSCPGAIFRLTAYV